MSKTHYTLYQTLSNINQKDYWGVHKTSNLNDSYLGSGSAINGAIKKYGRSNFTKLVTGVFRSEELMYWVESFIVDEEMVKDTNNYNRKVGGQGGWGLVNTPEIQAKAWRVRKAQMDEMTPKERQDAFGGKGSKNPKAKKINIYNREGILQHKTHGDFRQVCKDNNLPFEKLQHTYQGKCDGLYLNMRACDYARVINRYGLDYITKHQGWYAKTA